MERLSGVYAGNDDITPAPVILGENQENLPWSCDYEKGRVGNAYVSYSSLFIYFFGVRWGVGWADSFDWHVLREPAST